MPEHPTREEATRRADGRHRMVTLAILAAALGFTCAADAFGFDAEGIHTGMTLAEVAQWVGQRGLTLQELRGKQPPPQLPSAAYIAQRVDKNNKVDLDGLFFSLVFCDDGLVAFSHNIDFDEDYISMLQDFLGKYNTPQRVEVEKQGAPNFGWFYEPKMRWYSGDDRITLWFTPEVRTGSGALRARRSAGISYDTRSRCLGDKW